MLQCPLVIELVDDQDAQTVAQFDERTTVRVVAGADMVHAKLLHQLQTLLDSTRIGCSTQGT